MLGDIVISVEKVEEQAEKYGHSQTRELAFLVAHSMSLLRLRSYGGRGTSADGGTPERRSWKPGGIPADAESRNVPVLSMTLLTVSITDTRDFDRIVLK